MKNLLRYTAFILLAIFLDACKDDDKYPLPEITRGSVPIFTQDETDTGYINFMDYDESNLSFSVDRDGSEDVARIDVLITFNNTQTDESETITYNTVDTFPETINLGFDDLINLFKPEVLTVDTLGLGDTFVVGGNVLLSDGRYLKTGYSPSLIANEQVFLTYTVACASDLAGTYDFTLISGSDEEVENIPDQTIIRVTPGYYEISEVTMDIFGGQLPGVKYRFTDIRGTLTADARSVDYGVITVKFNSGTFVDPVTGVITFDVEYTSASCCGLPGLKTVFKATPK